MTTITDRIFMATSTQLSARIPEVVACPEIELILYCSRIHIDSQTAEYIKGLLHRGIDWSYLIKTTLQFGSTPLLFWNLIRLFSEEIPKSVSTQLHDILAINAIRNVVLKEELFKLLELLKKHEIPAIPFKGPVLAISAYGSLDKRIFSDLDILVQEQDFFKTKELLISQGYKAKYGEEHERNYLQAQLLRNDGKVNIDLHYGIPPKYLHLDPEGFWKSLEPLSISGQTIQALKPEAHLLIVCVNGNKDCWRLSGKLCDVAGLIQTHPDLDWEWLVTEANRLRIRRIIYFSLLLANTLLGTEIPPKILATIKADILRRWLVLELSKQLFSQEVVLGKFGVKFYEFITSEQRFIYFFDALISPTHADRIFLPLPPVLFFFYYLIRPIRLTFKYSWKCFECCLSIFSRKSDRL